jgi:hypothetical protein
MEVYFQAESPMRSLNHYALIAVCALALGACGDSNPGTKDGPVSQDGPIAFPDGPGGREGSVVDRSLVDQALGGEKKPIPDGAKLPDGAKVDVGKTVDMGKTPDTGAAYCKAGSILRCDCNAFSKAKNKFIPLWGKANQVSFNADFKVRVVNVLGELKVQQVTVLPTSCGKWQNVTVLADFTYQIVLTGEDFTIQYDTVFPGLNKASCTGC